MGTLKSHIAAQTGRKGFTVSHRTTAFLNPESKQMITYIILSLSHYTFKRQTLLKALLYIAADGFQSHVYSHKASSSVVKEGLQQGKLAFLNEFRSYEQLIILLE